MLRTIVATGRVLYIFDGVSAINEHWCHWEHHPLRAFWKPVWLESLSLCDIKAPVGLLRRCPRGAQHSVILMYQWTLMTLRAPFQKVHRAICCLFGGLTAIENWSCGTLYWFRFLCYSNKKRTVLRGVPNKTKGPILVHAIVPVLLYNIGKK